MGADTPAAGGEQKAVVKYEGRPPHHGGRNSNRNNNNNYNMREKFLGADSNLHVKIFEAKRNRSEQVVNFKTVDDLIKAQVGTEYDPFVLESLEKDSLAGPTEPTPIYEAKANPVDPSVMSEVEKMKFKARFDKFLTRTDKIEMQLKQVFSKYFGHVDDDMKGTPKEDPDFERAYNAKDVIALRKMLKTIKYNYKKSEEPIKTMYQATKDLILMKQHKKDCKISIVT